MKKRIKLIFCLVAIVACLISQRELAIAGCQQTLPNEDSKATHFTAFDPAGTLVLCGGGNVPDKARKLFVDAAGGKKARIVIVPTASADADSEADDYWIDDWKGFGAQSATVLHTRDRKVADSEAFSKKIADATGVWFSGGDQNRLAEVFLNTRAQVAFETIALRGGVVGGTSAGAAIASEVMIAEGQDLPNLQHGLKLLPWAIIDQHFSQRNRSARLRAAVSQNPLRVGLGIDEGTAVFIHGRSMRVIGEGDVFVMFAKTEFEPTLEIKLEKDREYDWTTFARQARERSQMTFPIASSKKAVFEKGALVIVGGGNLGRDIVEHFVELAGGKEARIVVLPTATTQPPNIATEEFTFRDTGAGSVVTLPQIKLSEINAEDYLQQLRGATGIWFGGGRQWNFVDHYEDTEALVEMRNCLERGGVIGGSSAGASIIGELLIRGAPAGNQIMVQDGYRRGFSFLPGVGIDQHFSQRERAEDLRSTIARFPSMIGVGIDEGTALIVTSKTAEVIGTGSVFIFQATKPLIDENNTTPQAVVKKTQFQTGKKFPLANLGNLIEK